MAQGAVEKKPEMISSTETIEAPPKNQAMATLLIVSKNHFQNSLLKLFLEDRNTLPCTIETQARMETIQDRSAAARSLVLYDCFGLQPADLWVKLGIAGALIPSSQPTALFNVPVEAGLDFEIEAIERQLKGIFCVNEPLELIFKGIQKMLQGEIWYSRKTTSAILMEKQRYRTQVETAEAMLTPREKEILIGIASGAGNNDIADELCISLHTVKTHVYHIYKKIDVANRLEATLWVARYL